MSTKHTHGPWRAEAWNFHSRTTVRAGDETIAECHGHGRDRRQCETDARLIAAAPALLAALIDVTYRLDVFTPSACLNTRNALEAARAAIAAATGEAA